MTVRIHQSLFWLSASAVHPCWEDHEEADPWWAPGPEDHVRGAHPEVFGCRYRPCESVCWQLNESLLNTKVHNQVSNVFFFFLSFVSSKLRGSSMMPTNVWRHSTTNSESRRWVSGLAFVSCTIKRQQWASSVDLLLAGRCKWSKRLRSPHFVVYLSEVWMNLEFKYKTKIN